jgi:hypothetical protein
MSRSSIRAGLTLFLKGFSKCLFAIGGLSFLFGDRAIREFGKVDFIFAEFLGIGFAALCIGAGAVSHYKAEDLEWEEANEEATRESSSMQDKPKS